MSARHKHRWASLIVAIIGVLVALGAWLYPNVLPIEVTREPNSTPGANPFMPPVGADQPGVSVPPNTDGAFAGNTPGLYGGTRNVAACDPKQMVAFLQQHTDKAAAWAAVLGIKPGAIPDYVARLTPVILRSDTYVTNHGFNDGRATAIPAALQAGTAVLVDNRGIPVTKCFCGNPLTAPVERRRRNFTGATWPTFSPNRITIIRAAKTDITNFTLVDPKTNKAFDRPSGTTGDHDQDSNAQGTPASINLDGPWHNDNNDAVMTIDHNAEQTTFHWILLDNPNDPGLQGFGAGPRPEVCTTPTSSIQTGSIQLTCQNPNEGTSKYSIHLNITNHDHVTVDGDPQYLFIPLGGSYTRCQNADACRPH